MLIIFIISFMFSYFYILVLENSYNQFYKLDGEKLNLQATVISMKKENNYNYEYIIKTNTSKKLLLYTKKSKKLEFNYGDVIQIKGNFSKPEGSRNYKGFDYSEYLKTTGIYGILNVEGNNIKILARGKGNKIVNFCYNLKEKCQNKINNFLPEDTSGLLMGLLFGEKSGIDDEVISDFQESSLAHILAVSGGNVSYIILGVVFILKKFNIPKRVAYVITVFILLLFMVITGLTASVTRACIMGIILLFSKVLYRKLDFWNSISLAVLVTLVLNPYTLNDVGFILSYGGVIGIILFGKNVNNLLIKLKWNSKILNIISITLSVQLVLIPIMIINFNTLSLNFILSNLLAIPLLGTITILGFIVLIISFISMTLAKFLAIFLNVFIKLLILIAHTFSSITFLNLKVVSPYIFMVIIYYLILFSSNYFYSLYTKNFLRVYERKILRNFQKFQYKKNNKNSYMFSFII